MAWRGMQSGLGATLLSLAMLAALLLGAGGLRLIVGRGQIRKGALMMVAGLVLIGNVLILAL